MYYLITGGIHMSERKLKYRGYEMGDDRWLRIAWTYKTECKSDVIGRKRLTGR
jgi:hypothetical protein